MNTKKILLGTGAALAGATLVRYIYKNAMLATKWDYEVNDFRMIEFAPRLKANFHFTIINKSNFSAIVKDIDISVFSDNKKLSTIYQAGPYTVAADGKTKIFVTIDVKPEDVFNNWRTLLAQVIQSKDIKLDFVGNMKIKTAFGFAKVPIRWSDTGRNLYQLYKEYYK